MRVHPDDDDPVQIALLCQFQVFFIRIRTGYHHMIAVFTGSIFNA